MKIQVHYGNRTKKIDASKGLKSLLNQVVEEFKVDIRTVEFFFKDEEGDQISVVSDSDLEVMTQISNGHMILSAQRQQ